MSQKYSFPAATLGTQPPATTRRVPAGPPRKVAKKTTSEKYNHNVWCNEKLPPHDLDNILYALDEDRFNRIQLAKFTHEDKLAVMWYCTGEGAHNKTTNDVKGMNIKSLVNEHNRRK
jgi:hypothetical protein